MPELPEVEVTRLGIAPHLQGRVISAVKVLDGRLRWPVPSALTKILPGQKVHAIERRGKYLLIELDMGHLLIHLGMTGTLRVLPSNDPLKLHDRVTVEFGKLSLRLHDPRKFGAVLWHPSTKGPIEKNVLLQKLGVEPFQQNLLESLALKFCIGHHASVPSLLSNFCWLAKRSLVLAIFIAPRVCLRQAFILLRLLENSRALNVFG